MSDGREEREQIRQRIEQEKEKSREDQVDLDHPDDSGYEPDYS